MPAFIIRGDECSDVVFCSSLEQLETGLENGHYMDYEEGEPAPQYDQFEAQGRVPYSVLLLDGWWFECANCYCRIDADLEIPPTDEYGDDQRKGLDVWAMMEPESWRRVVDRVSGANYGALYAGDRMLGYRKGYGLPESHTTWKSYTFFLLSTLPDAMRERFLSNFAVFLEWYQRHGYPRLDEVPDGLEPGLPIKKGTPSWARFAIAILKNDFNCKSLSIAGVKRVHDDVYERVANGEPVKVRKSVKPVYDFLRSEYERYLSDGIGAVSLQLPPSQSNPIKAKYANL